MRRPRHRIARNCESTLSSMFLCEKSFDASAPSHPVCLRHKFHEVCVVDTEPSASYSVSPRQFARLELLHSATRTVLEQQSGHGLSPGQDQAHEFVHTARLTPSGLIIIPKATIHRESLLEQKWTSFTADTGLKHLRVISVGKTSLAMRS